MNELEKMFRVRIVVQDNRYRILVNLVRSNRPRYWNFLCNNCGSKVAELQNCEIVDMTDFYDPQDVKNSAIGRPCKGTQENGTACPFNYFFNLH